MSKRRATSAFRRRCSTKWSRMVACRRLNQSIVEECWDRLKLDDAFEALPDTEGATENPAGMRSDKWTCVLTYVWEDRDRHGNVRTYAKVPGRKKVRIREQPGTPAFMPAAYQSAVDGVTAVPTRSARGSFGFACKAYYASAVFKKLDPATQTWRRNELDRICEKGVL